MDVSVSITVKRHSKPSTLYFPPPTSAPGRDLSYVVLVDNSCEAFCFHPENGVLVRSWFGDAADAELPAVLAMLRRLHRSGKSVQQFLEEDARMQR